MEEIYLPRPAEYAENQIIDAILEGRFAIGSNLPAERELASQVGVTRPTLREALQRLARDGWLEIRQGKSTRVQDYWHQGNLGVLNAIARRPAFQPADFIANLLDVRLALAPAYIYQAVKCQPLKVIAFLEHGLAELEDTPEPYANFDWELHHQFSILSGNPVFTLILNGFSDLYPMMARRYFQNAAARQRSFRFYNDLRQAATAGDEAQARQITWEVMEASLSLWQQAQAAQTA
jgi:GntR family transcriptional regulator, negative regulator for fad regulon and positive regulator of fabA